MTASLDKVFLITGSAQGIGWACAEQAARRGATIMLSDINADKGESRIEELISLGAADARFVRADISKEEDVKHLVAQTVEAFGRLDVAVNNAGISGESASVADVTLEDWNKVLSVNLTGVFLCAKYELSQMLEQERGVIINMASVLGRVGFASSSAYVAAKHGVIGLTKNIALEYAKKGIQAIAVGPGFIRTPLLEENLSEQELEGIAAMHAAGRLGRPEEIARLVVWLGSDESSFINGAYFPADGGFLAQ